MPHDDPRHDEADYTLLPLLTDELHKLLGERCAYNGGAPTCFELALELTLQGWTLPEAPPETMADLLK